MKAGEAIDKLRPDMTCIEVEHGVEVLVQRAAAGNGWIVYVNVDGVCLLRTQPIAHRSMIDVTLSH